MTQDDNAIIDWRKAYFAMNARLTALEDKMQLALTALVDIGRAASGLSVPLNLPQQLPAAVQVQLLGDGGRPSQRLHFGLDASRRAHWADVYSRLVMAGKLKACEVTSANFTYLCCGEGTPAVGPIRWYGSTRELAYMVRQHLGARWEVALVSFKDKSDNTLPQSFSHTKAPAPSAAQKIDSFFRMRD